MKERCFDKHTYPFEMATAVRVTGEDAFSFLQSQFSNDLSTLLKDPSACVYGLWLNAKGRVLADSLVFKGEDEAYYLFSEVSPSSNLLEHLESHIIADDVELAALSIEGSFIVDSVEARAIIQTVTLTDSVDVSQGGDCKLSIPHVDSKKGIFIYPLPDAPEEACVGSFSDASLYRKVIEYTKQRALLPLSENARHLHRIARGFPLIPKEIGPNDLAAEGGLVPHAVSLNKGCFLGQEVVARLHHLGKAQRQLYVITLEGSVQDILEHLPFSIVCSDRVLGEIRSLYRYETVPNCYYAVALIKERYRDQLTAGISIGPALLQSICLFESFSI